MLVTLQSRDRLNFDIDYLSTTTTTVHGYADVRDMNARLALVLPLIQLRVPDRIVQLHAHGLIVVGRDTDRGGYS